MALAEYSIGTLTLRPGHELRGGGDQVAIGSRTLELLTALAEADGAVLTKDELFASVWGTPIVEENTLHAQISAARKALGGEARRLVTVHGRGYRLDLDPPAAVHSAEADRASIAVLPSDNLTADSAHAYPAGGLTRRMILTAGAAVLTAAGLWRWREATSHKRAAALLVEEGSRALRQGLPEANAQGVALLRRAVDADPGNAKGWGMLALAWRATAEYAGPDETAVARTNAENAARRALAIEPQQSDALTALATLTPAFGDWIDADRRLRSVLAIDPQNLYAVSARGSLLMSTGQVRASLRRLNWLVERDPLAPNFQFRRIYTLWSVGRLAEMDRTADRALQSWPRHPAVWFARMWTLAFTDRAAAALAMVGDVAARPPMPPASLQLLTLSLAALQSRHRAATQMAIDGNIAAAARGPHHAIAAIMVLSQLGAAEQALQVARGFLARQGPVIVQQRHTPVEPSIMDQHHRMAMMLWIPATEPLRLQPRFRSLCDEIGLVEYWKKIARPDFAGALVDT